MMGGDVNVESEKGKGSTFSFSVKVQKVKQEEKTTPLVNGNFSFNMEKVTEEEQEDVSAIFHFGSEENVREIESTMEKLVLCLEMENWDRANTFAESIKQLVAEDAMNLKRKAFRLQMTLRKGEHETAMKEYNILKESIEEWKAALS
jgi:hypothetical protein